MSRYQNKKVTGFQTPEQILDFCEVTKDTNLMSLLDMDESDYYYYFIVPMNYSKLILNVQRLTPELKDTMTVIYDKDNLRFTIKDYDSFHLDLTINYNMLNDRIDYFSKVISEVLMDEAKYAL